ncbi:MFS transporter [Paraburkholderia metrosideri]|uniref:Isoprimeverose transporter n=1 Tax=Paraburkholderia metrosideri TaxID=580937 RepID=A0ABN7HXL2_9BURK|nr:glycoside-pentoside-hexuronide (GPH):cation symporter [Paraburkholderia metrosideri]CAD6543202.1 Isoprimeverose transporter [Paraburkholderia metrosideri]
METTIKRESLDNGVDIATANRNLLGMRERISYGVGDLASNLHWNMVSGFLMYYYTNVAMLPVAALGTLFLLARGLDAFADPAIGILVDRTDTRFGRARPYLLFGAIPLSCLGFLTFLTPFSGETAKLVYAYVTFLALGIAYSAVNIPYGALLPMMARDSNHKLKLGSARAMGSAAGNVIVFSGAMPLVAWLGHGSQKQGFALTAALFGIVSAVLFFVTYRNCREKYTDRPSAAQSGLGRALRHMVSNRVWIVTSVFMVAVFIRLGVQLGVTVYFALNVLGKPWAIPILMSLIPVGALVASFFAAAYYRRTGIRRGNVIALIASGALFLFLPFVEGNLTVFVSVYALSCVMVGLPVASIFVMVGNVVDVQEYNSGVRSDGLIFSSVSLAAKLGIALGGALVGWGLAFGGYDPAAVSATARHVISVLYYAVFPLCILVQIITVCFYDLDARHATIVEELNRRRQRAA